MLKLASPKVMGLLAVMAILLSQSVSADQINEDTEDDEVEADNEPNIEFTPDALSDFRVCLCEGTSLECRAIITGDDSGLTVTNIQRNGSFSAKKGLCKFYVCEISDDFSELGCTQVDKDVACGLGHSSEQLAAQDFCCDPVCQILYWPNPDDMIPLTSDEIDKDKCESTCSCPTETTTELPLLQTNATTSSTESIHITTSPTLTTESVALINLTEAVTKTTTDDTANIHSNETAQKYTSDSDDSNTKIVAPVVGVFVFVVGAVIVVVLCLRRRRHNRPNSPFGENGDIGNTAMAVFDPIERSTYSTAIVDSQTNSRMMTNENNEIGAESSSEHNNSRPAENSTNTTQSTLAHSNEPKIARCYKKLNEKGSREQEEVPLNTNSHTQSTNKSIPMEHQSTTEDNQDIDSSVPFLQPSDTTHH